MKVDGLWGIAAAIVTVALVTTVLMRSTSAGVISSIGSAFSSAIRAALGR